MCHEPCYIYAGFVNRSMNFIFSYSAKIDVIVQAENFIYNIIECSDPPVLKRKIRIRSSPTLGANAGLVNFVSICFERLPQPGFFYNRF